MRLRPANPSSATSANILLNAPPDLGAPHPSCLGPNPDVSGHREMRNRA